MDKEITTLSDIESDEEESSTHNEFNPLKTNVICGELKSILSNPRIYVAEHFSSLRNKVDIAYETFKLAEEQGEEESNESYSSIVKRINVFEAECFERLSTEEKIGEALSEVELEMEACASEVEQEKKSERMYGCLEKAKKFLFGGSTMVFWSKTELTRAKKAFIDLFGKLLFVSDEFIGVRAINDLK
jgi:hypothetical protein